MVSHGKVIHNKYNAERKSFGLHFIFEHNWDEYLSLSYVKEAQKHIKDFCQQLLDAVNKVPGERNLMLNTYPANVDKIIASISDVPHLKFKAFEGGLGTATSYSSSADS